MNELELLEKAIAIAVDAHRGQKDRYGAPYILHPLRVMARVARVPEKIVAILHDVVEDTDWTFEDLKEEGFGSDSLEALRSVTKEEGEEYEHFVARSAANPVGRRVKLADLEDNMDVRRAPEVNDELKQRLEKYRRAWTVLHGPG
jgi:(p)ppGpp synthase/HD superfamily hydrolase